MISPKPKALFLVHRIPYPPDKGDKIRSWQIFQLLTKRFDLYTGFFVDDAEDLQYVDFLRTQCVEVNAVTLSPRLARLRSLSGLLTGQPLSFPYYQSAQMASWLKNIRQHQLSAEIVFSSSMFPYTNKSSAPVLVDLCDADSAKWSAYAERQAFPMSWVYRREGRLLGDVEATITREASASFLITPEEAEIVRTHPQAAPENVLTFGNGVDIDYFNQNAVQPGNVPQRDLVFTGAMDYEPNIEAVIWFAENVWGRLREQNPHLSWAIVGARPGSRVQALSSLSGVTVTGRVDDIRPWIAGAKIAIAPLQIARGLQNKVLEAMAMAKPVIATSGAAEGIGAASGQDLLIRDQPAEYVDAIKSLLADAQKRQKLGRSARVFIEGQFSWEAQLRPLSQRLDALAAAKDAAVS
ncbi:TIGR03087 family PEP-CTERM/XrtA system glycosyltransferase [Parvularcula sp. IMCC14364]|uniref:TIGR03087 family PEP-CTERM/XrtA system glycosyltransferase n=1 Tax=Parvularcula sp. IMCC14364 TaxID=3067902 RepID=UPI002740F028|nr:TIGR03087 family PEP-CTERM/XrtA system glycosyltransferase [Parvularcula sp. IMCC14364]